MSFKLSQEQTEKLLKIIDSMEWVRGVDGFFEMKVRDIIKIIENDGWYQVRQRGSHRQFKHSIKTGLVTIAGKMSDDIAPGTFNSIIKQARLKDEKDNYHYH